MVGRDRKERRLGGWEKGIVGGDEGEREREGKRKRKRKEW